MDVISDKTVKTRKHHKCSACCRDFPPGTIMRTFINKYDGEINTWRECPTCQILLSTYRRFFEDEWDGITLESCVREGISNVPRINSPEELLAYLRSNNP